MYATNNASLLVGVWNILESYGIDQKLLFREMNLNPELMKRPGGRYRLDSIDKLWRRCSEIKVQWKESTSQVESVFSAKKVFV